VPSKLDLVAGRTLPPLLPSHFRGFRELLFHVSSRYPDMLEVGFLANDAEDRTHFSAWCIVSSPLVLGHNISDQMQTSKIWPIITNTQAIDVNQKFAGHPGGLVTSWNIGHDNVSDASTGEWRILFSLCIAQCFFGQETTFSTGLSRSPTTL
jgi:hypothetical protein